MSIKPGNNFEPNNMRVLRIMERIRGFESELREQGEKVDEPNDKFTPTKDDVFIHADEVVDVVELNKDGFDGQLAYVGDDVLAMDAEKHHGKDLSRFDEQTQDVILNKLNGADIEGDIYERATVERTGTEQGYKYTHEIYTENENGKIDVLDDAEIKISLENGYYG
jgi:hypothetical protein